MLTDRDATVIRYLTEFRAAHTSTLAALFFPHYRTAARRLTAMASQGDLKRARVGVTREYVYWVPPKPKQLRHALTVTDFDRELSSVATVEQRCAEKAVGGVRPDAILVYRYRDRRYLACLEVQLSRVPVDLDKYVRLLLSGEWRGCWPVFPQIIVVTDQRFTPPPELTVIRVPTTLDLAPLLAYLSSAST